MADFGLKIGVEGERDFRNSLREINDSFKVLGSEMTLVSSQFDKQDKSVEAITARNSILNKEIDAQKDKISTLNSALQNASDSFGANDKRTQAWQIQLNNANAALNGMEGELKDNVKALGDVSKEEKETGDAADKMGDEISEAGADAEKSGGKFEALGGVLKGIGAAMGAAFAAVGAAAIGATKALADMAVGTAAYADTIITAASVTGMSTDSLQAYTYAAELVDVSIDTLTGSMAKQIKSMSAARDGVGEAAVDTAKLASAQDKAANAALSVESAQIKYNDAVAKNGAGSSAAQQAAISLTKAQNSLTSANIAVTAASEPVAGKSNAMSEAYAKLGVSVADTSGVLRDGETVYWEAIDALGKMEEGAERDALSMQIFGKSAQDLNPLIAQGSVGIAALTEEAYQMGAVMSESSLTMAGEFDDTVQRLTAGSEAAKNALGLVLMPQLNALGTEGVDLLGNFTRGMNEADGDFGKMADVIGETISGIADVIMAQLPMIIDTAMSIVGALGGAIMNNLPVLIEAATSIIMTIVEGLIAALPQITDGALQLVLSLVDGIIDNLPQLVEAAIQMIASLAVGIADALPELIPAVVGVVMRIVTVLIENLPLILDAALQLIVGLAEGLLAAIPELIKALPRIISAIIDFLIGAIPMIINAGIKLLISLVEALPIIITAIVTAIPLIIDGIITAVIGAIPLLIDAGIKLLVALIENLPVIIVTIVKAIPQIISSLIEAVIGNIDKIIMAGVQLFIALIENLPTIIIEIVKAIPLVVGGIVEALGGLIWMIVEAGGNLIKGLWQGISDAGAWLWDKISGFFGGIVDGIKGFFGINSPSTLFANLGENMATGLGIGFGEEMNKVGRDMQKAIPHDFDIDAEIHGSYSNNFRGNSSAQSTPIYIYTTVELDKKAIGHSITPIVSQDLAFAARGGRF
ncbi:hypothetical protein FACS1894105_02760 [Clostridia bacterium]|nr:hypothetical protein FACS1894105_02760 [Clostridia bacterium]